MNQYEIIYRHYDMPPDYRGCKHMWARDEKQALSHFLKSKPDGHGNGVLKKGGANVIIETISQIS
jgi:hypothetical protein